MPADGKIIVPPDSTGKNVDTSELTRSDGTIIQRNRIAIGSPDDPLGLANVTTAGELMVSMRLDEVVGQLKRIALLLEILTRSEVSLTDVS